MKRDPVEATTDTAAAWYGGNIDPDPHQTSATIKMLDRWFPRRQTPLWWSFATGLSWFSTTV